MSVSCTVWDYILIVVLNWAVIGAYLVGRALARRKE